MYFSIAVLSWKRQRILSRVSCWKSPSFWRFKSFKGFHAQQRSWPQSCMELETSFSFFVLNRKDHKISKMASFLTQGIGPSVWTAGRNSNGRPRICTSLWFWMSSMQVLVHLTVISIDEVGGSHELLGATKICEWQSCPACAKNSKSHEPAVEPHCFNLKKVSKVNSMGYQTMWTPSACKWATRSTACTINGHELEKRKLVFFLEMTPCKMKVIK